MHSRIFQLSTEKLPQDEWINELSISDADMGYHGIDYCGDTDNREDDLSLLAHVLPKDVFKVTGDKIEIISDGSCLFDDYKRRFISTLQNMEFAGPFYDNQSWVGLGEYTLCRMARNILDIDFLFYIDDWSGCLSKSNELIHYAHHVFADDKPKVLYVNGILDYHF